MSIALELALARLYVDAAARRRFADDPSGEVARLGLSSEESQLLTAVNPEALDAQALIFTQKRARPRAKRPGFARRFWAALR